MDTSSVIYGTNRDKVDLICKALKLNYNVADLPNHPKQHKAFHLIGNFDCVLVYHEDVLFDIVFDYLKTMLNIKTY